MPKYALVLTRVTVLHVEALSEERLDDFMQEPENQQGILDSLRPADWDLEFAIKKVELPDEVSVELCLRMGGKMILRDSETGEEEPLIVPDQKVVR